MEHSVQELFPPELAVPVVRRRLRPLAQGPRYLACYRHLHDPLSPTGRLEVCPGKVTEGPHLRAADVRHAPGGRCERELRRAVGDLSHVYWLEEKASGNRYYYGERSTIRSVSSFIR